MSDDNNNKPLDALLLEKSAEIVMAFVANNAVRASDLHDLLSAVHATLKGCASGEVVVTSEVPAVLVPAVSVKKSVSADFLVCLEDGLKFKSMKRHLMSKYQLSPEAYRAKWGLPGDYPMVASKYTELRSAAAKARGFGQKGGPVAEAATDVKAAEDEGVVDNKVEGADVFAVAVADTSTLAPDETQQQAA